MAKSNADCGKSATGILRNDDARECIKQLNRVSITVMVSFRVTIRLSAI